MCRREKNKEARQAALVLLSAMQQCSNLSSTGEVYCAAKVILCTDVVTVEVAEAKLTVLNDSARATVPPELLDLTSSEDEMQDETFTNLQQ